MASPGGKSLVQCLSPEDELEVLIRARYPIIYVVSWEEERVEKQLGQIWVSGELSNVKTQSSGHIYFTLKDANSQLSCVLFRGDGSALPIASRTIRRCTPNFLATPTIVPTPNSYSRRISSNSSTLALQSNESPPSGLRPNQSTRSSIGGPKQTAELGQIRIPKSSRADEERVVATSFVVICRD